MRRIGFISVLLMMINLLVGPRLASAKVWHFTDVTTAAGFDYGHGILRGTTGLDVERKMMAGGVAAGDIDGDGWVDLYVVRGDIGPNLLFRNLGNGTFEEMGARAGLDLVSPFGSVPIFADVDGDKRIDLFIGGILGGGPKLFRNRSDGTFEDITAVSGLRQVEESLSAAFGDYDRDGDLDLFLSHWVDNPNPRGAALFQNNGKGVFSDVTAAAGLSGHDMKALTPNFADINNDQWPDLLIAGDFGSSMVFINQRDGTFLNVTDSAVMTDENGMGAAIGDYDHDGDLDWFVSSIHHPDGISEGFRGASGNRFYRNRGDGTFEDVTDETGVRDGFWGWGSCFGDFNNDGFLDLFHVNGFGLPDAPPKMDVFRFDPSRFFVANGDGTFREQSNALGLDDTLQGRGIVCFDYDRDGDLDIFVANNSHAPRLYRNDGGNAAHFLNIKLVGLAPNTEAIGARIYVTAGGVTQMRELRTGSNFASQNPVEVHFGLGTVQVVDEIRIIWSYGAEKILQNVPADQFLVVTDTLPTLSWPTGETNGVAPDNVTSGSLVTFKVTYTDAENRPPTCTEVWIDENDDGQYASGGGALAAILFSHPGQHEGGMNLFLGAAVGAICFLMISSKRSKRRCIDLSIILFLVFGLAAGCGLDGNRGRGAGVTNVEPGETRPILKSERFSMKEADTADQDFTDGKEYFYSMSLNPVGDGSIRYRFKFKLGTRSVTGDPSLEQRLTIG